MPERPPSPLPETLSPRDVLGTPPPAPDGLDFAARLDALRRNLERLSEAFDGIAPELWERALPAALVERIAREWTPGPHTLLEMLGYARDEEAYVFGRRAMRIVQEHEPVLEHLTFEQAAQHTRYDEGSSALHFAELVKNRLTYIAFVHEAGPLVAFRAGELPAEEGGGKMTLEDVLGAAMRRDIVRWELVRAAREVLT